MLDRLGRETIMSTTVQQHIVELPEAEQFFYDHAGWAYTFGTETPEAGRLRVAYLLAEAERWVQRRDAHHFVWEYDDDARLSDAGTEYADWPHYWCSLQWFDAGPFDTGTVLESLGGIMLRDREDYTQGDPYVRVVEAELALEAMIRS